MNIEFRAWYMPCLSMLEWDGMYGIARETDNTVAVHVASGDQLYFFSKDIILMQWTGLRDKSGKKIYQNDIVKIPEGYGGDHHYPECIAIVQWDAPSFILWNIKNKHGMVGQEINSDWSDLEVIGNTLQNKELLE